MIIMDDDFLNSAVVSVAAKIRSHVGARPNAAEWAVFVAAEDMPTIERAMRTADGEPTFIMGFLVIPKDDQASGTVVLRRRGDDE